MLDQKPYNFYLIDQFCRNLPFTGYHSWRNGLSRQTKPSKDLVDSWYCASELKYRSRRTAHLWSCSGCLGVQCLPGFRAQFHCCINDRRWSQSAKRAPNFIMLVKLLGLDFFLYFCHHHCQRCLVRVFDSMRVLLLSLGANFVNFGAWFILFARQSLKLSSGGFHRS